MVSFTGLITIVSKHNMDYHLHYLNINDIKNFVKISANFKGLVGHAIFSNLKKRVFILRNRKSFFAYSEAIKYGRRAL